MANFKNQILVEGPEEGPAFLPLIPCSPHLPSEAKRQRLTEDEKEPGTGDTEIKKRPSLPSGLLEKRKHSVPESS